MIRAWSCMPLAAVALAAAADVPARNTAADGRFVSDAAILFKSSRPLTARGLSSPHAVGADGRTLRDLGLASGWEAHWSPDGRRIAFGVSVGGVLGDWHDIYVVGVDVTRPRRVARTDSKSLSVFEEAQLSWAPDGRRIAFTEAARARSARSSIGAVGVDGRRRMRLTRPVDASDTRPTWSPDGRWLAFVRDSSDCGRPNGVCGRVFLVSPDGRRLRRLPTGSRDGVIGRPSWSPDARRLAFALCCGGGVYVLDVATGRRRRIDRGSSGEPAWSPNGRWIAFAAGGLFVARPDGSGYRRISARATGGAPTWSPDSSGLAFMDGSPDIWAVGVDGSGERRLTEGWRYGYGNYEPEWNPRGLSIDRLGGTMVPPSNPSDSQFWDGTVRTTRRVERLSADGSRVAYRFEDGRAEVWEPPYTLIRFDFVFYGSRGFAFAGERAATTEVGRAMRIDSWALRTATVSTPKSTLVPLFTPTFTATSTPVDDLAGDGPLLVAGAWGPCRITDSPPCAREPKRNGRLFRVDDSRIVDLAADPGPLTLLSVDRNRILADRENGALQLFRGDGKPLYAITYGPARLLGAKLEGDDVAVLTTEGLSHYDARTGDLKHHRRLNAADALLTDVHGGVALYVAGREIRLHRLTDGREVAVRAEGEGQVLAELEAAGLFYAYAVDDRDYPGRVAFVPLDRLGIS